ncbi:uncharacterized protein VTP21DRAFT_2100 [Calcarisporiella thermophila]|uniref:uncharacterized protein n=1 Tax=Calcarisporiella thermophila TaxID=911321 RepID=UPI003742E623
MSERWSIIDSRGNKVSLLNECTDDPAPSLQHYSPPMYHHHHQHHAQSPYYPQPRYPEGWSAYNSYNLHPQSSSSNFYSPSSARYSPPNYTNRMPTESSPKRKYFCSHPGCGKSFTTSGHLARHNRVHTGEKNYACLMPGCSSRFSRQDNMWQHYKTHLSSKSRRGNNRLKVKSPEVGPEKEQVTNQSSHPTEALAPSDDASTKTKSSGNKKSASDLTQLAEVASAFG